MAAHGSADDAPAEGDGPAAVQAHDDPSGAGARDQTAMILEMVQQARGMDQYKGAIQRLQDARKALATQKREVTMQLRNERRKRQRLLHKSCKLSVPDLVQSLCIRQARAAEREQRQLERAAERGDVGEAGETAAAGQGW